MRMFTMKRLRITAVKVLKKMKKKKRRRK